MDGPRLITFEVRAHVTLRKRMLLRAGRFANFRIQRSVLEPLITALATSPQRVDVLLVPLGVELLEFGQLFWFGHGEVP